MKILQILPELNVGGVERGTVDFARYLVEHGHQSLVISNGGEFVKDLEQAGSRHYALPVHKKSLFRIFKMVKAVRQIIQDEKIDIVHARSRVPAWIAYFACRRTNASFITTCHGYYKNRFFSQVMGWGKLVIVPSEAIGRHMIEDFGVSAENIRFIARSVDLEKFGKTAGPKRSDDSPVVSIVGRITPLKGHMFFIKAMAKVIRTVPYAKIWIIGDTPAQKDSYRRELDVLVRHLGIQDNVEFLGNRRDIPELLAQTDVLVLSTVTQEAFGRVILEAQAAGVPVVATKVGGVVDIIDDGKTGILVMPKDIDGMAREVLRLLKDRDLGRQLTIEAQKKIKERFTLEHMASQTLRVYEELLSLQHILVIKISSIGDVVLVTASLRALRQKFPRAKIYCVVGKEARQVLQNCPYLDGLIIYDPNNNDRGWLGLLNFAHRLRAYKFDKVIDFQNNRKSHLLAYLSFAKESYGYHNGKWSFLLSHPLSDYRNDIPAVMHQFQLLNLLGIPYQEDSCLELWPASNEENYVKNLLEEEWLGSCRNLVGINISASSKWQSKNWPVDSIARLCDLLAVKNIRVVVTGMEKDKHLANRLLFLSKSKPADLVGKTDILHLAQLIKLCQVYITPDSAPLHVAAAMGTPVIALFGPTDSRRHMPPARKSIVLEEKLPCSPCYSPQCRIRTHECMKKITPEQIAFKVESLLGESLENSFAVDAP